MEIKVEAERVKINGAVMFIDTDYTYNPVLHRLLASGITKDVAIQLESEIRRIFFEMKEKNGKEFTMDRLIDMTINAYKNAKVVIGCPKFVMSDQMLKQLNDSFKEMRVGCELDNQVQSSRGRKGKRKNRFGGYNSNIPNYKR